MREHIVKRACFNIGIGRELYTAPFIWIGNDKCNIVKKPKGDGFTCYDRFAVKTVEVEGGNIVKLEIVNAKTRVPVFAWSKKPERKVETAPQHISVAKQSAVRKMMDSMGVAVGDILPKYGVRNLSELTEEMHLQVIAELKKMESQPVQKSPAMKISEDDIQRLSNKVIADGVSLEKLLALYKKKALADFTYKALENVYLNWDKIRESCSEV